MKNLKEELLSQAEAFAEDMPVQCGKNETKKVIPIDALILILDKMKAKEESAHDPCGGKLEVQTNIGTLLGFPDDTPGKPGIIVMLKPKGVADRYDVSEVYVAEDPDMQTVKEAEKDDLVILDYADPYTDDYIDHHVVKPHTTKVACFLMPPNSRKISYVQITAMLILRNAFRIDIVYLYM